MRYKILIIIICGTQKSVTFLSMFSADKYRVRLYRLAGSPPRCAIYQTDELNHCLGSPSASLSERGLSKYVTHA